MPTHIGKHLKSASMPNANRLPPLSDAQMEIMRVVWDRGEVAVGEVWDALSKQRPLAQHRSDGDDAAGREGLAEAP